MAALVQSFPQQTTTVSLLPTPGTFPVGPAIPSHSQHTPRSSATSTSRSVYGAAVPVSSYGPYRGQVAPTPVTSYVAAASQPARTPTGVSTAAGSMHGQHMPHLRQENRTFSAPGIALGRLDHDGNGGGDGTAMALPSPSSMPSMSAAAATTTTATNKSEFTSRGLTPRSKDDSAISTGPRHPSLSSANRQLSPLNLSTTSMSLSPPAPAAGAVRPSPERYRRHPRRSENNNPSPFTGQPATQRYDLVLQPTNATMVQPPLPPLPHQRPQKQQPPLPPQPPAQLPVRAQLHHARSSGSLTLTDRPTRLRTHSVDDLQVYAARVSEPAKRYRRRSSSSALDSPDFGPRRGSFTGADARSAEHGRVPSATTTTTPIAREPERRSPVLQARSDGDRHRKGSSESVRSTRSNQSRSSSRDRTSTVPPASISDATVVDVHQEGQNTARGSGDAHKRSTNPSPLSRPVVMTAESPGPQRAAVARGETVSPVGKPDSPAAQQLAELSEKDAKQGVKSRLRRAFSFGSASELRRASAANSANHASAERARLRKERYQDEEEAKQAAIVQKQEAGGIGEGIYSGQGHFFTGSSDNLSVSSTASSASVMIRKMGKGMKKSSRSLVGLFRPRSVVGVPAAGATDSSVPGASEAQVSMVTAEAERQKVNVNVDPHDQAGGGTGFPRLERNSLDVAGASGAVADSDQASSVHSEAHESSRARRSIVGGDLERAEVLAAVRKGILKRRNQPSAKPSYSSTTASSPPAMRPLESKLPEFVLPAVPRVCDSPHSSAPTTPAEEGSPSLGHRRTDSVRIEGEDYFAGLPRMLTTEVKSDLDTPTGITKYAVSFSPRIQFHDTWPSGEYDRRGEIATCNRLTPMLAQQIKEELNTFKMEMDVHEQSKVYTHFF